MRFLVVLLLILSFGQAQTANDESVSTGSVSKDLVTELFKRLRGGDVYVGTLPPSLETLGLSLDERFKVVGGFEESFDEASTSEAYLHYEGEWQKVVETLQQQLENKGWSDVSNLPSSWGFASGAATPDFGEFCSGSSHFSFSSDSGSETPTLRLSLDTRSAEVEETFCEEEEESIEATEERTKIPPLLLTAPNPSLILVAENLPYNGEPLPKMEIMGVTLPGGWSSRAVLSTTLSAEDIRKSYDAQLTEAGWTLGRTNSDELNNWSEWTFTDEAGQKWLATLNVTHHESFKNLLMPVLVVLTVE
jgi:hypothetical protein